MARQFCFEINWPLGRAEILKNVFLVDLKTPKRHFEINCPLKAGKSLTRINYIKNWLPEFVKPICLTHLGTNQFIRAAYLPKTWSHRMSAIDGKTGKLKKSEEQITYDVAGPLCFQVLLTSSIYSLRGELREGALDSNSFFLQLIQGIS